MILSSKIRMGWTSASITLISYSKHAWRLSKQPNLKAVTWAGTILSMTNTEFYKDNWITHLQEESLSRALTKNVQFALVFFSRAQRVGHLRILESLRYHSNSTVARLGELFLYHHSYLFSVFMSSCDRIFIVIRIIICSTLLFRLNRW